MVGILLHYLLLVGFVALLLWLIVPRATDQLIDIQRRHGHIFAVRSRCRQAGTRSSSASP